MKLLLTNRVYDVLKWIVMIGLPAVSVLVATLGQIWGWVGVDKIVLTINAVTVFLGALIGVSTATYNKANGNR